MTMSDVPTEAQAMLDQEFKLLIGGKLTSGETGARANTTDPATGEVITDYPSGQPSDINAAVAAAKAAQPGWAAMPLSERQAIVRELGRTLNDLSASFGYLDTRENGNVYSGMRYDAEWAASVVDYFCGIASEVKGEVTQLDANLHYTRRQPFGVVAKLLPFNHPIQALGTGLAAPLLMGNTLIIKPSPHTPLSTLAYGAMIKDMVPPGVINVVTGDNENVAAPLISHPDVARVALTGSVEAGRAATRLASEHLKSVSLELGGKNPLIIFPDADVDFAADIAVAAMNYKCQSHSCSATSRVLVHKSKRVAFLDALVARVRALNVAMPMDQTADVGAISTAPLYRKILEYMEIGKSEGATLLTGGDRPTDPSLANGMFMSPAIFSEAEPHMKIAQEEIYGSVTTVLEWDTYDQMIEIANGVAYGLTAVIVTDDLASAHKTADALEAGYVEVNGPVSFAAGSPYGGWKLSGGGREGNMSELLSYTQLKSVNVNYRSSPESF